MWRGLPPRQIEGFKILITILYLRPATDGRAMAPAWMEHGAYHIMDGTRYYVVWRGSTSIDKSIDRPAMDRMNG